MPNAVQILFCDAFLSRLFAEVVAVAGEGEREPILLEYLAVSDDGILRIIDVLSLDILTP